MSTLLEDTRELKTAETQTEGLKRCSAATPELIVTPVNLNPVPGFPAPGPTGLGLLGLLDACWVSLNVGSFGANMVLTHDIYLYMQSQILWISTASQAQLDAYAPATDPNWPN